jgi:hypothetical protein
MSRSLIVMPDDTAKPILDAIDAATKSLRVKMFIFSDPYRCCSEQQGKESFQLCPSQQSAVSSRN